MASDKKLYRSRDSLIGGVCAGVADYFNIDPIIVQILTVVLTIATAGLLAVAYIALWIIIPRAPDPTMPVDVQPHEVHSDTYGQVTYRTAKAGRDSATPETSPQQSGVYDSYTGAAHVPPPPPKDFTVNPAQSTVNPPQPFPPPYYGTAEPVAADQTSEPSMHGSDQAYAAQQPHVSVPPMGQVPPAASPSAPVSPQQAGRHSSASGALWFGLILLFIGICALLGTFVDGVEWWQFWPLVFVVVGIGQMAVPGRKGHRMSHFVNGLMQCAFGATALAFSLGVVALSSLESIFVNLWPILVIMGGFFVLGGAMDAPIFTLLAGLSFVAFCAIGLGWFSASGPTEMLTLTLPTGQMYTYDINPWI